MEHAFTLISSFVRLPSDLLYTALYRQSIYEKKLMKLDNDLYRSRSKDDAIKELRNITPYMLTGRRFTKFIENMDECEDLFDQAHSEIRWELFRVQPVRRTLEIFVPFVPVAMLWYGVTLYTAHTLMRSPFSRLAYPLAVLNFAGFCVRVNTHR